MDPKDIIKNINAYKLDNNTGSIQLNINEYNYNHSPQLINKLKEYMSNDNIIQYSSLNSNNQSNLIYRLTMYLNVNNYQILLMNGGDITINNILKTYASNDSNIIIYGPTYSQYERLSKSITNHIYNIDMFNLSNMNNLLNLEQLTNINSLNQNDNNKRTICFICNPNNPTGREWREVDLKYLFHKYPNVLFIIDETYIDFSLLSKYYNNERIYSCSECINQFDNIIVMRSFSKAFGLAGLRISYIVSNVKTIDSISSITSHKDVIEFSKLAANLILENLDFYKGQIDNLINDKKCIIVACNKNNIKYIDTKCNFILINAGDFTNQLTNMFLKNKPPILVKNLYGAYNTYLDNYIRVSLHFDHIKDIISILQNFTILQN